MTRQKSIIFISLTCLFACFRCAQNTAGIETTNGATIVVNANKVDGTIPPFSSVYLCEKDYIPYIDSGLGVATAADMDGYFLLNKIHGDSFSIAIISNDKSLSALLNASSTGSSFKALLSKPGALEGSVTTSHQGTVLIFLCGTGYYILLDKPGPFMFKSLPAGKYRLYSAIVSEPISISKPFIKFSGSNLEIEITSGNMTTIPPLNIP